MVNKIETTSPGKNITAGGLKFKAIRVVCDADKQRHVSREQRREYQARWEAANAEQRREQKRERVRAPAPVLDAPAPVLNVPVPVPVPAPVYPAPLSCGARSGLPAFARRYPFMK